MHQLLIQLQDPEAELIIGAITDSSLDGKMRVSIVATSLDGQQPEAKSVINMVHRIQNRNPGYSDFSNMGSNQSFTFSSPNNSIITNGANALKIEEEVKSESQEASDMNEVEETNYSSNIIQEPENQSKTVHSKAEISDEKEENIEVI